jgi:hypothetical protein
VNLRVGNRGQYWWVFEVLFDGQGKFACANSLEVGCLFLCRYEADGGMRVSVFDDLSCRHHSDDSGKQSDG